MRSSRVARLVRTGHQLVDEMHLFLRSVSDTVAQCTTFLRKIEDCILTTTLSARPPSQRRQPPTPFGRFDCRGSGFDLSAGQDCMS
ncbi:MAG: hypothetical protein Nkreftii_000217 [Candidatus Nitrospira kreftii]|uniref:Uncharacterized protein n=1 Tax=Candidatus Nitrospira kreftii TaxID=2652173 RepID=A0A7S8FAT7_9BACT|nr:MAG: hypothetical protein Nkreftii_000217 [Candidatus Nitrospira kreftii]